MALDQATILALASDPAALQAAIAADAVANAPGAGAGTAVIPAVNLDQLPAHLQVAKDAGDHSAGDMGSATDRNRISIKGKVFTLTGSDGKDNILPMGTPLEVVILAADPGGKHTAKAFYPGTFVEGGENMPTCYSADGLTPDEGCDDPQNEICTGCPHNAFGTGINADGTPGKGKRCGDSKKLFVVAPDGLEGDIYEMSIPPTSLRYTAAKKYPGTAFQSLGVIGNRLAEQGVPAYGVKVAINFIAQEASPVLTFDLLAYLTAEEFTVVKSRLDAGDVDAILPSKNKTPAQVVPKLEPPAHLTEAAATPPPAAEEQLPACPLGAPAGHYMLDTAGATYASHIAANWTDELLIQHGKMS